MTSETKHSYLQAQSETVLIKEDFTADLHLQNITSNSIMFKIKTTAPNYYLVKPHFGVIPPNRDTSIKIMMKRTDIESLPTFLKDKFQVNSVPTPENPDPAIATDPNIFQKFWDGQPKSLSQAKTLKVSFSLLSEKTPEHDQLNANHTKKEKTSGLYHQHSEVLTTKLETINEDPETFLSMQTSNPDVPAVQNKPLAQENEATSEIDEYQKILEAKLTAMRREIDAIGSDIDKLHSSNNDLITRSSKQQCLLEDLLKEKKNIQEELEHTKTSTFIEPLKNAGKPRINLPQTYQLWHVVLIIIVSFILGLILTP